MLFRDRRTHAHTRQLMETEAGMSREAWGRAMDASDLAHGGVISLRTTQIIQDLDLLYRHYRVETIPLRTSSPHAGAGDSLTGTGDDIAGADHTTEAAQCPCLWAALKKMMTDKLCRGSTDLATSFDDVQNVPRRGFDAIIGMDWLAKYQRGHQVLDGPSTDLDMWSFKLICILGAAPVARHLIELAPSEKERSYSGNEGSYRDKGFIRPNSSPWGASGSCLSSSRRTGIPDVH
ncbi:hypothetical protein Tco_0014242 [Tanacetum coccineum]